MPVLADLFPDRMTDRDRRALLGRLAELRAIDHLVREVPAQQPPKAAANAVGAQHNHRKDSDMTTLDDQLNAIVPVHRPGRLCRSPDVPLRG